MCQVSLFYRVRNCKGPSKEKECCKRSDDNKQRERGGSNKFEIYIASQLYNQMMPRLPGCLFNFIKNQPPEVFILLMVYVQLYKKTEKLFLEISHKIHKENTCVLESLFKNLFKKRLWRSCFLVNFADFFSENTSCNLGDCQQMLLLFIDLSLTFLSELGSYPILTVSVLQLSYFL